eukprot:scaffold87325_cov48-Phaeocystis_antarctica.AAC.4
MGGSAAVAGNCGKGGEGGGGKGLVAGNCGKTSPEEASVRRRSVRGRSMPPAGAAQPLTSVTPLEVHPSELQARVSSSQ